MRSCVNNKTFCSISYECCFTIFFNCRNNPIAKCNFYRCSGATNCGCFCKDLIHCCQWQIDSISCRCYKTNLLILNCNCLHSCGLVNLNCRSIYIRCCCWVCSIQSIVNGCSRFRRDSYVLYSVVCSCFRV